MPLDIVGGSDFHQPFNPFPQDSKLYFEVYERPVYFKGGQGQMYPDNDYKALIRVMPENNYPKRIGMVKKSYHVLHMEPLCKSIENNFLECMDVEEISDVQVVDQMSYYGGMMFRQYIFPHISTDLGDGKSTIAFRTIVGNGYDGSTSFKLYNGSIDFFCTNGQVHGIYDMLIKRHTSSLTIPKLTKRIRDGIDIFYKQADTYREWISKEITDEDAKKVFEAIPNVSERRVEQLIRQYHIEAMSRGPNVWALYSAATYYASHNEGEFSVRNTNNDNQAATLMNRETQIRSWLNTEEFQLIAA